LIDCDQPRPAFHSYLPDDSFWPGAETQSWGVNLIYTLTWRQTIRR